MSNTGHGPKAVGAGAKMRDLAQKLERVALFGNGVTLRFIDPAHHLDRCGRKLNLLLTALRGDQRAGYFHRTSSTDQFNFIFVVGQVFIRDHLERIKARAVIEGQKGESTLRVAFGADPALTADGAGIDSGAVC